MLIHPHQPATGAKNAWIIRPSNIASDIAKDITPPNMAKENITPDYPLSNIIPSNIARNITPDDPLPKYCNRNRNQQGILRQITSQPNITQFNYGNKASLSQLCHRQRRQTSNNFHPS